MQITYAEEILISKTDLEDKNSEISTQRAKVEDLKLDMEYQAQKHDIQHIKEMKSMEDEHRYCLHTHTPHPSLLPSESKASVSTRSSSSSSR